MRVRSLLIVLGVAVLVVLVANHLFAVPPVWSVALSLPVAGVLLLGMLLSGSQDTNWEPPPATEATRAELHASTLTARFAEAARDRHRFVTRVQPRLRRLALATLRARMHDLHSLADPRARAALGPELHTLLTDEHANLPAPKRLVELMSKLEE